VADAGREGRRLMLGHIARLGAVEDRRRQHLEAQGRPAGHVGLDVLVQAEDLLHHHDPALARALGLGVQRR
jgi:hypothetical protein